MAQALFDGLEAVGKEDYQTAVAHFRQAAAAETAFTLSTVQLAVTHKFGEERWRHLIAYIKSLPDKGQLRPTDSDVSNAFSDGLEAAGKEAYQTAEETLMAVRIKSKIRKEPDIGCRDWLH